MKSNPEFYAELGRRLRAARVMAGLSGMQAAGALGIAHQQVHRYEIGANRAPVDLIMEMARLYGCTVSELIGGDAPEIVPGRAALSLMAEARRLPTSAVEALVGVAKRMAGEVA